MKYKKSEIKIILAENPFEGDMDIRPKKLIDRVAVVKRKCKPCINCQGKIKAGDTVRHMKYAFSDGDGPYEQRYCEACCDALISDSKTGDITFMDRSKPPLVRCQGGIMNREIKFRAWDTISKRFYEAGYMISPDGNILTLKYIGKKSEGWYLTEEMILVKTTGLHDKNGKEIYEGDIIFWPPKTEGLWSDQNGKQVVSFPFVCGNAYLGEVIGNIYENPELLNS